MSPCCVTWRISPLPASTLQAWLENPVAASLDEISGELPQGAYTTFRTFDRVKALHLDDHLDRLDESARLVGFESSLDRVRIRDGIRQAISTFQPGDARIRLTLDLEKEPGTVYISLEPLNVPAEEQYRQGVSIVTRRMQRNNPRAKLTGFIGPAIGLRRALPPGVVEVVMIDENGRFLEGLSSNFFAVKGGILWTADQGVLPGITRSLVLEGVQALKFPLRLEGFPSEQAASAGRSVHHQLDPGCPAGHAD